MTADHWVDEILSWYSSNQRTMPWRTNPDPYYVWISEIMLQQTQVETVIPYFSRFINKFPTLKSLAEAELQDVLKIWEGLGYYARARNLHKAAIHVVHEFNGQLPNNFIDLKKLPGLGDYTAAALASIAFGETIPVVDGNVLRVFARFWGIKDDIKSGKVKKKIFNRLSKLVPTTHPSEFNQGVMELGALVCRPQKPTCSQCPIQQTCIAFDEQLTETLPIIKKKAKVPLYQYGACIIRNNDKILISKRDENQMLGGLWQFPGGRLQGGGNLKKQINELVREITSLDFNISKQSYLVKHAYSHFKIELTVYECELIRDRSEINDSFGINQLWIRPQDFDIYPFDKATSKVIELINYPGASSGV